MKSNGFSFQLCAALLAALPALGGAQQPAATAPGPASPHAPNQKAYSCVDPSDALARRRWQAEPCKLPSYHLPLPVQGAADPSGPRRWPAYPPREPGAQDGHAMFWRFPVQPMGPLDAPSHGRR